MNKIGLLNFFKNRFNILYIIIIAITAMLSMRLATLTIVEGEKYREQADVKKVKDIPIKAPRGKIYDRNGVLLADNLTSFTVQIYKNKINVNAIEDTMYQLSKILDENGETLVDEFPIVLDTLKISNSEIAATNNVYDYILQLINDNGLIDEWLNYSYHTNGYNRLILDDLFLVLDKTNKDFPVVYSNNEYAYIDDFVAVENYLANENIDTTLDSYGLMKYYLENEEKYLSKLFSNAKTRKYTYNFLLEKGLAENIQLLDFSFKQDELYNSIKLLLSSLYEGITMTSTAKEDFLFLTKYFAFDGLFSKAYDNSNGKVIPANYLIEGLKKKYSDLPVTVVENDDSISYEYTGDSVGQYLIRLGFEENYSAYEFVRALAFREKDILDAVIVDNVSGYAQAELLAAGINPSISISAWEYTPIYEKNTWIKSNLDGEKIDISAKEAFNILKDNIDIEEELSIYEARNILLIKERYNKQGFLSYYPVDIAYNVSEKTVAMISERNHELSGVNIEIEPIRYYPMKSSAAHILGYLGKISQESEIEKYLSDDNTKYSLDDIIGKTGIEESFEDYLAGTKGKKTVAVNVKGNAVGSVDETAPIPGDNTFLTIDQRLQQYTEEKLEKILIALQNGSTYESEWGDHRFFDKFKNATSGAVVVIDVKTGELLTMANYPSYDLNLFATGITSDDWNKLMNDSKDPLAPRPLYNISMLTAIQPGSTFKMITALAALEKGVNPNTQVYCAGVMDVGGSKFGCWLYNMRGGAHGGQNIYQAIRNSCNFYFFTSMLGYNPATGQGHTVKLEFEDVANMAIKFGLNDKTGIEINLPNEFSGGVPDIESKKYSSRLYLRFFLEDNLKYYVKDDYEMGEEELKNAIDSIVNWIGDDIMTRSEVYSGLESLNIDPEKVYNSRVPIVDIIKYTYINHSVWNAGDSLNLSIGQGGNSYTPLQMANYVATIANGGYRHNVSVVQKCESFDGKTITYEGERKSERVELSDYGYLDIVKEGMRLVSLDIHDFRIFPVTVGVKTGTAEKDGINPETGEEYDTFAWQVAFAPYDDPQIAVACVIFQGGLGTYPAPLVRDVIAEYLVLTNQLERPVVETVEDVEN